MQPTNGQTLRTLLAVRVSTVGQGIDGDSPEAQIEQGERYAPLHNMRIVMTLQYLESASKEQQPMQEVINYCKRHKGEIDVVLIKSIDRFTRAGSTVYDQLKAQLEPLGVTLVDMYGIISTQKVNTLEHLGQEYKWSVYSPTRKTELLEAERAKDEVRDILSRMIGSEIRYTQLGYWSRGARFGYKTEKIETVNGKRAILVPDGDKADIIRMMFEERAAAVLNDHEIAEKMNDMGFETPIKIVRDKRDRTRIVSRTGGKKITAKLLRTYVKQTIYAGVNTEKWTGGVPVKCKFDGLVSMELFNKANRGKVTLRNNPDDMDHPIVEYAKKDERFVKKNHQNPDYPYKKVVTCPHCRRPLLGSASRGRLGKYYAAYHCSNHGHHFRVRKDEFEGTIDTFIKTVTMRPERVEELMQAVMTVYEQRQGQKVKAEELVDKRRSELEAEIKVIVDKMKLISSETAIKYLEEDLLKLEREISNLDNQKQQEAAKDTVDVPTMLTYVKYFMEHIKELLVDHCNPIKKAQYFGVLFDEVATYEEIKAGTAEIEKIPGVNELFKLANSKEVSLVRIRGLEPPRPWGH